MSGNDFFAILVWLFELNLFVCCFIVFFSPSIFITYFYMAGAIADPVPIIKVMSKIKYKNHSIIRPQLLKSIRAMQNYHLGNK